MKIEKTGSNKWTLIFYRKSKRVKYNFKTKKEASLAMLVAQITMDQGYEPEIKTIRIRMDQIENERIFRQKEKQEMEKIHGKFSWDMCQLGKFDDKELADKITSMGTNGYVSRAQVQRQRRKRGIPDFWDTIVDWKSFNFAGKTNEQIRLEIGATKGGYTAGDTVIKKQRLIHTGSHLSPHFKNKCVICGTDVFSDYKERPETCTCSKSCLSELTASKKFDKSLIDHSIELRALRLDIQKKGNQNASKLNGHSLSDEGNP